jgi:hypothetical protein
MYVESSILHLHLVPPPLYYGVPFSAAFICPSRHNSTPSFLSLLYTRTAQVIAIYNTMSHEKPRYQQRCVLRDFS